MKQIVKKLIKENKTISIMEACTGGALSTALTDIPGSSKIFNFAAVTYSNEYIIKMGVSKDVIDEYTVYSMETSDEMSNAICDFTSSDFGIGVIGQLNRHDIYNIVSEKDVIYISIYSKRYKKFYNKSLRVDKIKRHENKKIIVNNIKQMLNDVLKIR